MGLHGDLMVALIDGGTVVPVTWKILLGCGEMPNVVDSQVGCSVVCCVAHSSSMLAHLKFCVVLFLDGVVGILICWYSIEVVITSREVM